MKKHSQIRGANRSIYILNIKMSLTAVLFTFISIFQIQANSTSDIRMSLDLYQVPVADVIKAIEAETNYKFLFKLYKRE